MRKVISSLFGRVGREGSRETTSIAESVDLGSAERARMLDVEISTQSQVPIGSQPSQPSYFYDEDNISTPRNHDFAFETRFQEALAVYKGSPCTGASPHNHHGRWNLHVVIWAATQAIKMNANIVQFGVFEGSEAAAIASFTKFENVNQEMFLVDTFTGVPEEQWTKAEVDAGADSAQHVYKKMGDLYPYVEDRFSRFENIHVIQGRVPEVLPSLTFDNIGLLMLDMNAALPERAAAEHFWERVVPGGFIISDDYGHSRANAGFIAQKVSFDEFARSKGVEVLSLPTGHGIIVKA